MATAWIGQGRTARCAALERGIFEGGPPLGLHERLGLARPGQPNIVRRMFLAVLVGWLPLAVLTSMQSAVLETDGLRAFLSDVAVHARFLAAAPLLILAEVVCAPRLGAIAGHFRDADLVTERDRPRFDAAVASTRASLDSTLAEVGVLVLAYAAVVALVYSVPLDQLPAWHRSGGGATASYSPAGWWHALVSLPLLLLLLLGWIWRLCLWARFLWLVSRLDLRLVPAHPDHAAGLMFVGYSVRALSILALALGTILAGGVANGLLRHPEAPFAHKYLIAGAVVFVVVLFTGPLLVFTARLQREWRRGVFAYGALADHVGQQFERKWLGRDKRVDDALDAPDFSATTDLYQVVSNLYAMRFVPVDLKSVVLPVGALLLPFVPVALMTVPGDEVLAALKKLLF